MPRPTKVSFLDIYISLVMHKKTKKEIKVIYGISERTFFTWKKRVLEYGNLSPEEIKRLKKENKK